MSQSALRTRLHNGETVLGTFQVINSIMVAEMIGIAGFDYVIFDQEHGAYGPKTSMKLAAGAENTGAAPIVRVSRNDKPAIQRALDIGSAGVQVPQVETKEDAERAVEATRFEPIGSRGLSQYVRAGQYRGKDDYTDRENRRVTLIVQVEGTRGINNIDEILAVDGIDVVFLGPYDLSQSLGIPGQVNHHEVESRMKEVCDKAQEKNVIVGAFSDTPENARQWIETGVQYVTLGVDGAFLTNYLESMRSAVSKA